MFPDGFADQRFELHVVLMDGESAAVALKKLSPSASTTGAETGLVAVGAAVFVGRGSWGGRSGGLRDGSQQLKCLLDLSQAIRLNVPHSFDLAARDQAFGQQGSSEGWLDLESLTKFLEVHKDCFADPPEEPPRLFARRLEREPASGAENNEPPRAQSARRALW